MNMGQPRDTDVPLPEAQKAELFRRLATLDQDRNQAVTWEQLQAELARRHSR
jgi:putative addiction module component (TIGR02574 family)